MALISASYLKLKALPDFFESGLGFRYHGKEFSQFFTGVFFTAGTIINMLFRTALPYFANIAIAKNSFALGHTAIAVNSLGFDIDIELLGPQLGNLFSFGVIILLGCHECGTFTADYSTKGNHLVHSFLLFTCL